MLVREKRREAGVRHLRLAGRNCEHHRNNRVLPPIGFRRRSWDGRGECVSGEVQALAARALHRVPRRWILAATSCEAVRGEAKLSGRRPTVGRRGCRRWNDPVPPGDCRIHRRPDVWGMEVRKRLIAVGVLAAILLLGAVYLWVGSATPQGQDPLATLTPPNTTEFEDSFDISVEGPRLVLLLSPT